MYVQHKLKVQWFLLVSSILGACFSPPFNTSMAQPEAVKEATGSSNSGVVSSIQNNREANKVQSGVLTASNLQSSNTVWKVQQNPEARSCNAICKVNTLTGIGMDAELAKPLVENCKRLATDPRHCIISWASIIMAESGGKLKNCRKYNCMGLGGGSFRYTSYEVQIIDWISRYQKYWYKAKSASFFYPARWEVSKSRYCTSEESSGSTIGCPNWLSHASSTWNILNKKF